MIFSNRQLVPGVWHESHLVAPMEHVACFAFAAVVCGEEQRFNTDSSGVVREIMTNSGFFHSFFMTVHSLFKQRLGAHGRPSFYTEFFPCDFGRSYCFYIYNHIFFRAINQDFVCVIRSLRAASGQT
jgi:hypothetical protein